VAPDGVRTFFAGSPQTAIRAAQARVSALSHLTVHTLSTVVVPTSMWIWPVRHVEHPQLVDLPVDNPVDEGWERAVLSLSFQSALDQVGS
jgi:hypothetical protein